MSQPKADRRRNSARKEKTHELIEIVVSFSRPDPKKSAPADDPAAPETVPTTEIQARPPVIFRL